MTTETSNARVDWVLVPRVPTPEMVQASNEISCRAEGEEHWAAMLAAAPQPPSAPVGVEGLVAKLRAVLCDPAGNVCIEGSDADRAEVQGALDALEALAQQPAAVDEAMVELMWMRRRWEKGEGEADGMAILTNAVGKEIVAWIDRVDALIAQQQGGAE